MKIMIGAGGSGGHVFPALETAKVLASQGHEVVFLTTHGLAFDLVRRHHFQAWVIASVRMKLTSFFNAIREGFQMVYAIYQAWVLMQDIDPDVVVGFGGYGAFPVIVAAIMRRKPTLIHDQNVVPSWSNRVLKNFVNKIAISFTKSEDYFRSSKTVLTGCPCRDTPPAKSRTEIFQQFQLSPQRKTIFVLGGSQGSRKINAAFSCAVELLSEKIMFQFIHVCGHADYKDLQLRYRSLKIPYQLFDFLDDVQSAYAIADLVVARSGAATVCEILSFQKPAILIPYPLVRVHQKENAEIVCEQGLATMISDEMCTVQSLSDEITRRLKQHPSKDVPAKDPGLHTVKPALRIAEEIASLL